MYLEVQEQFEECFVMSSDHGREKQQQAIRGEDHEA